MTTTQPEDTGHSEFGASGSPVWLKCTGSIFLSRQAPDEPAGDDATRGTKLHDLADTRLAAKLEWAEKGTLYKHRDDFFDDDVSESDRDVVEGYVNDCFDNVLEGTVTGKVYGVEDKMVLDEFLAMFGTADFWVVYKDDKGNLAGAISDLKTGFKERDPKKDSQLGYYAVMLQDLVRSQGKELAYVRVRFYQPALQEQYPEYKWTAAALDTLKKKLIKTATDTYQKKKPKFKAGEHCEHCRVSALCPTYAQVIEQETALKVAGSELFELPAIETLSDEQIAALCVYGKTIKKWVDSANELALNRHADSNPVAGIKVVRGQSRRKIADAGQAEAILRKLGLDDADIFKKTLRGIGDLSRLVDEKTLEKIVIKPEGKPTVVSPDDPRDPIPTALDLLIINEKKEDD